MVHILGAGLSGCLAGVMNPEATIIEAKTEAAFKASPEHKAVLRFRTNKISQLTGIPFKEVQVRKSIWYQDREFRFPDIRLTNMYSRKVADGYFDRSIVNLETVTRWLPPEDFHVRILSKVAGRVRFGYKIGEISKTHIGVVLDGRRPDEMSPLSREGPIISTIAMPIMAKILGLESPVQFSSGKKVYVVRLRVQNSNLNVSMYYPDPDLPVYRASVMGDVLSIEMIQDMLPVLPAMIPELIEAQKYVLTVLNSLGIDIKDVSSIDQGSQLGKISYAVDDRIRKNWILKLTLEHGIYSLGRFALWKNILQDDVFEDSMKIRSFIESGTHYEYFRDVHL